MKDVERWKTPLLCQNEQSLSHYAFCHLGVAIRSVESKRKHLVRILRSVEGPFQKGLSSHHPFFYRIHHLINCESVHPANIYP